MVSKEVRDPEAPLDFIRKIIEQDLASGKHDEIVTRFPPEPNGYLHVGHVRAICLNFSIAAEYGGRCHLRFDDTNPSKESSEFVEAMIEDIRWLGWDWGEHLYFASNYFEKLYDLAQDLIRAGHAYVCDLSAEEIRAYRGTLTEPGRDSPFRDRDVNENLELFHRMRDGAFADGERTLRAKIDMRSPNLNLRDPVLYRVQKQVHHHTGDRWCIYPMYDYTHPISDALEGVTHSLCTLEFEDHRPLYDWFLDHLELPARPRQIEFAPLTIAHSVVSKRKMRPVVEGGYLRGWDDPRSWTIAGLRRRGYTPEALRSFCAGVGLAKRESLIELPRFEFSLREDLNARAQRAMAVLRPLKLVIENYPEGQVEELEAVNNPEDPGMGTRRVPFSRDLYIEREDFHPDPPRKYFRLGPGREVRLRYGYFVTCVGFDVGEDGEVCEVRCTYDPETRGGNAPDGRRVKGTIHWVSASHAIDAEVRLYGEIFTIEDTSQTSDLLPYIDPSSLEVVPHAKVEPFLGAVQAGDRFQFERVGYFCADPDSTATRPVFNRSVTLRDSWARIQRREGSG